MRDDIKYWLWLSSIPSVGARRSYQLLQHFKNPENIWNASEFELIRLPCMNKNIIEHLQNSQLRDDVQKHLHNIYKNRINVITINDKEYPFYLKNIYDPPTVLFVLGKLKDEEKSIAIVGSRRASPYGLNMAESVARQLAENGVTVVSGMARGIDTYAHHGALKGSGRTIAVLGCGLDIAYPSENRELMKKISENGAVISEYLPGMPPVPQNFPARNRIISGLSLGVVVVEANEKSGSLITASFALDQGREVFALPGNINNKTSKGTNRLIKDGAKIVTEVQDILEEINVCKVTNNNYNNFEDENEKITNLLHKLDIEEKKVVECILQGPVHIDALAQKAGMSIQALNAVLVMLELNGVVEQEPGKMFKLRL